LHSGLAAIQRLTAALEAGQSPGATIACFGARPTPRPAR
jgi:hypothetical protein